MTFCFFLLNCKSCKVLADDHEYHFFINCKIYPENKILFLINVINKCYAQFQSFDNFVKLKFIINTSEFLCRVNKAITGITKMKSTILFLYVTYFVSVICKWLIISVILYKCWLDVRVISISLDLKAELLWLDVRGQYQFIK
jgi:hypothetical protein